MNLAMPLPRPPSPAPRVFLAALGSGALRGDGENGRALRVGVGWDPQALVSFNRLSLPVAENSDERRRGSPTLSELRGLSSQLATLAVLSRHSTSKCGEERSLAAGLANSRVLVSSATRAPGDGDFRAPATRSTGFKTDLIPQPAPVPCRSKRALSTGGTFPDLGLAPAGCWGSREKGGGGVSGGWRNPSDKFFFFALPNAGRASSRAAGGMGSPGEKSPGRSGLR